MNAEEAQLRYEQAMNEWEEFKLNAKQHREREILDYHISSIEGDTEKIVRYKKKIIKGIKKKLE